MKIAELLVLAVGNPSRGDDALGPQFLEQLTIWQDQRDDWEEVELLSDFQLHIEHAVDLENRKLVLFVDASVSCPSPFQFSRLPPCFMSISRLTKCRHHQRFNWRFVVRALRWDNR